MKDLRYVNKFLLKYKYYLLLGTVFIILSNFMGILPAVIVRNGFQLVESTFALSRVFNGTDASHSFDFIDYFSSTILLLTLLIIGISLLKGMFMFCMRQTIIVMSRHIEFDMKNEIYSHYQKLPTAFYRRHNTGDLMARISEDVSMVRMYIGPAIMYGINLTTLFLMVIPYMIYINPKLTLYSLIPLPLLSISIYLVSSKINKKSTQIQKRLSQMSTFVQEAFSGIRVIKSFVREVSMAQKFHSVSEEYKHQTMGLVKIQAFFMPLIMGLIGFSVIMTIYVGATEVLAGKLSIGNIAEFIIYVSMLTWPVTSLGWITSIVQRAEASQKRINEFLNQKNELTSTENIIRSIEGKIRFENVYFDYPDSGIKALKNISFEIEKGDSLAIIGGTGSGKSTLANLICRLYDTAKGQIFIDNIPLKNYEVANLRNQIGYVPQDVFLFSDTIENNIIFGNENLTPKEIEEVSQVADLYNTIQNFPKKFQTFVGERGITLSGGQKQRVSIARAIAKNPKLLILDDALSAVDTQTENKILNALQKIMKDKTTLIISHRVSSAKLTNKIIVLDKGEIAESGNHESLMQQKGVYKSLYDKQLAQEKELQ